jgi:superfamily II DNA/RNA helicase
VNKRQALIDEFTTNPGCKVFLSTDSGGTGLNLQAADCVLNFELPWNPARLNQRIGRVNRIGQASTSVNVINLVSKNSIEEKILAGIHLKTELFTGVFDGGVDEVEFSRERRNQMLNQLRAMMGEELSQELPVAEARASEEIPDDTPHFLNPKALAGDAEEEEAGAGSMVQSGVPAGQDGGEEAAQAARVSGSGHDQPVQGEEPAREVQADSGSGERPRQSPEQMEAVLNQGLEFMSGLLEMATGQKLHRAEEDKPMLQVDTQTGEVTMKFKLPGF